MASNADPDTILFAQHGWADTGGPIASLARAVAPPNTRIVAPNLGLLKTWFRIEPLIARLETIAAEHLNACPDAPIRIIGHSMGGVIWLEVLQRHPEWWPRVASFVLIGSPVGGSDVGRLLDPLGLGIGIARDLGYNRREIAERIAAAVPTISIAGDLHDGTDGLVPLEATRFAHARWIILKGLSHPILRTHPRVANAIREIWYEHSSPAVEPECALHVALRQRLQSVPGMTDAHSRH
ncbi:MAG TPA: hypothetical protein VKU00_30045, partial [Chthonomonadaceae bacterium]|nr:hypothetical protein [Chthonomonadaceae bacterium]